MKRILLAVALLAITASSNGQAIQLCACATAAGCTMTTDVGVAAATATGCTLYKNSVLPANLVASGPTVLASTIPLSNATMCSPASPTFIPGLSTNIACKIAIPQQPVGNVIWILAYTNGGGEGPPSVATTFQIVTALPPTVAPTGLRPY